MSPRRAAVRCAAAAVTAAAAAAAVLPAAAAGECPASDSDPAAPRARDLPPPPDRREGRRGRPSARRERAYDTAGST